MHIIFFFVCFSYNFGTNELLKGNKLHNYIIKEFLLHAYLKKLFLGHHIPRVNYYYGLMWAKNILVLVILLYC